MTEVERKKVPRILFFAEAATLAHVARPFVLGQGLAAKGYEIHLGTPLTYRRLFDDPRIHWHDLESVAPENFRESLAKGRPLFDAALLKAHVEADLALMDSVAPDIVIGDLRLSLAVSARIARIPYATISNAYWSPYARHPWPVPDLPFVRLLGPGLGGLVFRVVRPLAFAIHTLPLNQVSLGYRRGLVGLDLRRIYTEADLSLYADLPEVIPLHDAPPNQIQIGPVEWSPQVEPPEWWGKEPTDRPLAYVSFGSSGGAARLAEVLRCLRDMGYVALVATAGRFSLETDGDWVFAADYLPGRAAAARADLVVCNGGSPATMQALAEARPVLGLPSNLDQYLNMYYVQRTGVGLWVRGDGGDARALGLALERLRDEPDFRQRAWVLAQALAARDPVARCAEALAHL